MANAAAWALDMLVIFVGMDQVPWGRGGLVVILSIYLICGLAGVLVGVIHGRVLGALLRESRPAPSTA